MWGLGSTRGLFFGWTVPGSPSLRSRPWNHSQFGSHLEFTALLPPSLLSDSASLEGTFLPFSSPAEGVGDGEGREERGISASFCRLLQGCCAREVPL